MNPVCAVPMHALVLLLSHKWSNLGAKIEYELTRYFPIPMQFLDVELILIDAARDASVTPAMCEFSAEGY